MTNANIIRHYEAAKLVAHIAVKGDGFRLRSPVDPREASSFVALSGRAVYGVLGLKLSGFVDLCVAADSLRYDGYEARDDIQRLQDEAAEFVRDNWADICSVAHLLELVSRRGRSKTSHRAA